MGRSSIKVDLIIVLKDGFDENQSLQGTVAVVNENGVRAIEKGGGCYVYCNSPKGECTFNIIAEKYYSKSFKTVIDENLKTVEIFLSPKNGYKFNTAAASISGKMAKEAEAVFIYPDNRARIIGAEKKGSSIIHAVIPSKLTSHRRLFLGSGKNFGIFTAENAESPTEYKLESPLGFDIDEKTQIGETYAYIPDESETLFAAAKGMFEKAVVIAGERKIYIDIIDGTGRF